MKSLIPLKIKRILFVYKIKLLAFTNKLKGLIEQKNGLDFSSHVFVKEVGFSQFNQHGYVPINTRVLKKILLSLNITKNDSILDFGCGKGKAMYQMTKFPFKNVDGVEISSKLCAIAEKNMEKLNIQNTTIFNSNASEFKELDKYNYFYFYNPFPNQVFTHVMSNIENSLNKNPREITIIYYRANSHSEIIKSGTFHRIKNKKHLSIYSNKNNL